MVVSEHFARLRIRALEQGLSMQALVMRAVLKRLGTPEVPLTAERPVLV